MSTDYPPPQSGAAAESGTADDPSRRWKTWHLAAASVLALFVGIAMGGAGTEATDDDAVGSAVPGPAETVTVTETVQAQEGEPVPAETVTVTATPQEQAAAPADPADSGDYRAGDYSLSDVQVREDGLGDFEVRARATNTGSSKGGVCISATIFSGGSVVGTADGCVQDWGAGETRTVEFISTDDYQEWDEIEFQVDTEY